MKALYKGFTALNLREPGNNVVRSERDMKNEWGQKQLHGRYYALLTAEGTDSLASCQWLTKGHLFPETEGFVMAMQDQVIATKAYRRWVLGESLVHDKCRMCNSTSESIQHIVSGCSVLEPKEYLHRHNNVAKIIHKALCSKFGLLKTEVPYYKYNPPTLLQNAHTKLYWETQIVTDRSDANNKPDILVMDRKGRVAHIVDVAIPNDDNMQKSRGEKIRKYQDLSFQLREMYNLDKTTIAPIILSTSGLVPRTTVTAVNELGLSTDLVVMQPVIIWI
ncbi:uncharacterized protein [Rhodnius prolixus]|uniref:uncharacterized protein n=1 Tax=Rhodnius prolixus TaxID=13249 RepID=UPI003D18DFC0